jgi:hypothetical protein
MRYKGIMRRRKGRETSKSGMEKRINTVYKRTELRYDNYCKREEGKYCNGLMREYCTARKIEKGKKINSRVSIKSKSGKELQRKK